MIRTETCLNGWWDFNPVTGDAGKGHAAPGKTPDSDWLEHAILVPGSWTRGGPIPESCARPAGESRPWDEWRIPDNYGYPAEWDAMDSAWYRRSFHVEKKQPNTRVVLHFQGILRHGTIFVNDTMVGHATDGLMPAEFDVTDAVGNGENELLVYVTDFMRDANGKTFTPVGADQALAQKGIWQDVFLRTHSDVFCEDVTIRTSVQKKEIGLVFDVKNQSALVRTVRPHFKVEDADGAHLVFEGPEITLQAGETRRMEIAHPWASFIPWSHRLPHLYHLVTTLRERGWVVDDRRDRFGFREIAIDGHRVLLNGEPLHLFGEWGHKNGFENFRPEYIRQWFRMLRDCNMNYIRTHTFPHTSNLLNLADEMGILVCLESGFMFGGSFALDKEEFWQGALQHVRNIVRRDKNHPSIIFWSVGNETRWSGNQASIIRNLPRLRALYEELDPTRITYHEGDSTLWDENGQKMLSRHYGYECSGEGWWDRRQPLHVGEVGKWHYGQPVENLMWGDDGLFGSFEECHRAIARETADLAEQARANEVTCFFPWNLTGLDNYRPWKDERRFEWPNPETPGIKPLRSAPYGSEFAWWDAGGPGYAKGPSFDIMKHAFRPFAAIVREKRNRFFDDSVISHTVTLVNDTGEAVDAGVSVTLSYDGTVVWRHDSRAGIAGGGTHRIALRIPAARTRVEVAAEIVTVVAGRTGTLDSHARAIRVTPASARKAKWLPGRTVAVFGSGPVEAILKRHGVRTARVGSIAALKPAKNPVLLVLKDAIQAGSGQNTELEKYVAGGGRAVVLEQSACVIPSTSIDTKPAEMCHIRGGMNDILRGFDAADFRFWGDDPYGKSYSDSYVAVSPYRKPASGMCRALLHSGFGDFGGEGLNWSPLLEVRSGRGTCMLCQARVSEKAETHPAAHRLLGRMLEYAAQWKPPRRKPLRAASGKLPAGLEILEPETGGNDPVLYAPGAGLDAATAARLRKHVAAGGTALVTGLDADSAGKLGKAFGIRLAAADLGPQYHLVRALEHPLLDGISNQETFWIDKLVYTWNARDRLVTNLLLECPEGVSLLTSERESCWREFLLDGGGGEWLRMPVATHLLWDGPRRSAGGLIAVKRGRGLLLLCQVPPPDGDHRKSPTFWSHLLSNLGVMLRKSAFSGECTTPGSRQSDGFPARLLLAADPPDGVMREMLRVASTSEFRIENQAIVSGFDWTKVTCPDGTARAPDGASEVVICFQINAGRLRMAVPVEGGLPDPSRQTLLHLAGSGAATLYVNGRMYETVTLDSNGRATVADIDLDKINNTLLLKWRPGADRSMNLLWKNREGRPEIEFRFQ